MTDEQLINAMPPNTRVGFFMKPSDKMPTTITVVQCIRTDYYGKTYIKGEGIHEEMPFYHFKPWAATAYGTINITNPLDDLHKLKNI